MMASARFAAGWREQEDLEAGRMRRLITRAAFAEARRSPLSASLVAAQPRSP